MIISASRRTDIPAFYGEWFINRVREGFFYRVNPFNSKQVSGFSINPEIVDAFCFWSKNPQPLMPHLDELDQRGYNYYFQFTLNPYGPKFEPKVPAFEERIATFQALAERIGPERVIWRYDPVVLTSATPVSWHIEQAEQLAERLGSSTRRLMFSFYDFYGKGQGHLSKALQGTGIDLEDIRAHGKRSELKTLAGGFKEVADLYKLQLFTCSESIDLSALGVEHGACIDRNLIHGLFGGNPSTTKDKNQREDCGCVESVDMGMYNSCPFHCSYCYANSNQGMVDSNVRKHFKDSPALLGRNEKGQIEIQTTLKKMKYKSPQLALF